jgi:hypothetical protein
MQNDHTYRGNKREKIVEKDEGTDVLSLDGCFRGSKVGRSNIIIVPAV